MTDEQLQAIRERWNACNEGQVRSSEGSERFRQWLAFVAADEQDLLAEVERMLEIVQDVANMEARQSEGWQQVGLFHDSLNVLYVRDQARQLLNKQ